LLISNFYGEQRIDLAKELLAKGMVNVLSENIIYNKDIDKIKIKFLLLISKKYFYKISKFIDFLIQPKLTNPNVIKMIKNEFRNAARCSRKVFEDVEIAKRIYDHIFLSQENFLITFSYHH
jgi:hypothetical protein